MKYRVKYRKFKHKALLNTCHRFHSKRQSLISTLINRFMDDTKREKHEVMIPCSVFDITNICDQCREITQTHSQTHTHSYIDTNSHSLSFSQANTLHTYFLTHRHTHSHTHIHTHIQTIHTHTRLFSLTHTQ